MCNLQSNLKLNKRKIEKERAASGREKRRWRKKRGTLENARQRESSASILTESLQDLSKISSRTVCRSMGKDRERRRERERVSAGRERKKGETAQCARGSRDIVVLLASLRRRLPKPPKSWMLLFVSGFSSVWKFQRARRYQSARGRWRCSGNVVPRELLETNDTSGKKRTELSLTSKQISDNLSKNLIIAEKRRYWHKPSKETCILFLRKIVKCCTLSLLI